MKTVKKKTKKSMSSKFILKNLWLLATHKKSQYRAIITVLTGDSFHY